MHSRPPARDALAAVQGHEAWAVIRRKAEPTAGVIGGTRRELASLLDIPVATGVPEPGRSADTLVAVPYRQVTERGFEAIHDDAPLVAMEIVEEFEVDVADLMGALPEVPVEFADRGGFGTGDDEYAAIVEEIIRDDIGQGEGANLVIARHHRSRVAGWGPRTALTVLRRLLERERGAYWTYCFFTGDRYLIGASPERHVSSAETRDGHSNVRMNPISGTFRVRPDADAPSREDPHSSPRRAGQALTRRLMDFLVDEKEIFELFMVVDEELKMMCDVCHEGGQVVGPFLKPMTHLIHTEYLLAGRTEHDPRRVLRDTMFAATVTGSPVENACRLIARHETEGRGYYSGALALFGRTPEGLATMDSPILIRTADVSVDGEVKISAGATLVRDSDPAYEVAETHAKAGGIMSAFGLVPAAPAPDVDLLELARDEEVLIALNARNRKLSTFWLTDQAGEPPDPRLRGRRVGILDGEDDFVNMLRHVLGVLGMDTTVIRYDALPALGEDALDDFDLVVVGPGPGDPRADDDPKMRTLRATVARLLRREQPFLAVCLGHQALCHELGLGLHYKDIVFQGTQSAVGLAGRTERVGFYNTFVARTGATALPEGVVADADRQTGDVHALWGPHYAGIQFHAESILTERGYDVLHGIVHDLLR